MSKNILVISASLRNGSNSDMLADEFMRGALESGNKAEKITLRGKNINFCKGCLACQKAGKCVINDDMAEILLKMQQADVICFASPVYFYDMCGQLKTFLDRTNPLFPEEYNFTDIYFLLTAADTEQTASEGPLKGLQGWDIYFLLTAADTEQSASEGPLKGLQGWIDCFENAGLKGVICGLGAEKPGDVKSMPAMNEAYMLGKQA